MNLKKEKKGDRRTRSGMKLEDRKLVKEEEKKKKKYKGHNYQK